MKIDFIFTDGNYMTYNDAGIEIDNSYHVGMDNDEPTAVGIYSPAYTNLIERTLRWGDLVQELEVGHFTLPEEVYLHNGQVVDEGRISSIVVINGPTTVTYSHALTKIEEEGNMGNVRVIVQEDDNCILWVSGEVEGMSEIVEWAGGFYMPVVGDTTAQYTAMFSTPCGNTDGDIIVWLHDDGGDVFMSDYRTIVSNQLVDWGVEHE